MYGWTGDHEERPLTEHCDIAELLPGGGDSCPVCATRPRTSIVLDAWDELRAVTSAPEPEPFVLTIAG